MPKRGRGHRVGSPRDLRGRGTRHPTRGPRKARVAMRVWPGSSLPLGVLFDGVGSNVAVFSDVADAVELCLFDDDGTETRVELPERSGSVWHGYLPDLAANTHYGFRVHG